MMKAFAIVVITAILGISTLSGKEIHNVSFTRNDGQINTGGKADCRFYTSLGGANYFFCADGVVEDFQQSVSEDNMRRHGERSRTMMRGANASSFDFAQDDGAISRSIKGHVLKLNFLNRTNFLAEVNGQDEQSYKYNYFIGNNSKKWHTDVPNYSRIIYKNVWEGIDIAYYNVARLVKSRNDSRDLTSRATLEYDAIVHPGADPTLIQFSYEGAEAVSVNDDGALVIKTSVGDVIEGKPYVYQIINGERQEVPSTFSIHNSSFTIQTGEYDKTKELIIDPALVYSTYLGGTADDIGWGVAVDKQGYGYIVGETSGPSFPTKIGSYDTTYNGGTLSGIGGGDIFLTKIHPLTGEVVFSTYIGGDSTEWGLDIALRETVEGGVEIYITGKTASANFPVTSGAYDTSYNGGGGNVQSGDIGECSYGGGDAFVTKLNSSGNAILNSTFLGGTGTDCAREIKIDGSGNVYLVGSTWSTDFPGATGNDITVNVFVAKLNSTLSSVLFSKVIGGTDWDLGNSITLGRDDSHGSPSAIYITGHTRSVDFPVTALAFQNHHGGATTDAFVTKMNASGDIIYSTYLGGAAQDLGYAIGVDDNGNFSVTGRTLSGNFPTTLSGFQSVKGDGFIYAFITTFDSSGNLLYSTYLGGGGSGNSGETGHGLAVDKNGYLYIAGQSYSKAFPTTQNAFQKQGTSGEKGFIAKINPFNSGNSSLMYSTLFGHDIITALAIRDSSRIYMTGLVRDDPPKFYVTNNAYQKQNKYGTPGVYNCDAFFSVLDISQGSSGVENERGHVTNLWLGQNYPNPFSSSTTIPVSITEVSRLEVNDLLGRMVYQTQINPQAKEVHFRSNDLRTGIYIYTLAGKTYRLSKTMIVSR